MNTNYHDSLIEQARFGDQDAQYQLERDIFGEVARLFQEMLKDQGVEQPQDFLTWAGEIYATLIGLEELDLLSENSFDGMCGLVFKAILDELKNAPDKLKRGKDWRAICQVNAYFQARENKNFEKGEAMWLAPRLLHKLNIHNHDLAVLLDLKYVQGKTLKQIETETGLSQSQVRYRLAAGESYLKSLKSSDLDYFGDRGL